MARQAEGTARWCTGELFPGATGPRREPARLGTKLPAGEPARSDPAGGDCAPAIAGAIAGAVTGDGLSPRGLLSEAAICTEAASVLTQPANAAGHGPSAARALPARGGEAIRGGEASLGEAKEVTTAMGSAPARGLVAHAARELKVRTCEDTVLKAMGVTGDATRGLSILEVFGEAVLESGCPCCASAATMAALELMLGVDEEAARGDRNGGWPPDNVVAATVTSCEEALQKETGERARGLSILFDFGGLAITALRPAGDLGGEIRVLLEPGEPAADLADTGCAAEILSEPSADMYALPIAALLGEDRQTTTGRGGET